MEVVQIMTCYGVKITIVDAEAQWAFFFEDSYDRYRPFGTVLIFDCLRELSIYYSRANGLSACPTRYGTELNGLASLCIWSKRCLDTIIRLHCRLTCSGTSWASRKMSNGVTGTWLVAARYCADMILFFSLSLFLGTSFVGISAW